MWDMDAFKSTYMSLRELERVSTGKRAKIIRDTHCLNAKDGRQKDADSKHCLETLRRKHSRSS